MISLVAFDLDGTLALSKQAILDTMSEALADLLDVAHVAVISGGDWPQFEKQIASRLPARADLTKLWLLPTTGTKLYTFRDGARKSSTLSNSPLRKPASNPRKPGATASRTEAARSPFPLSARKAPIDEKEVWDPDFAKRKVIQKDLYERLPEMSINMGGATSINITQKGVDKAYGLKRLRDQSGIPLEEMMFIGDAIAAQKNKNK
ncbi:HAD-superhydrolase, subIIB family protein [Xylaria cubensis]|nr:HAD-superhydrolase, subIIB family protein [Xylaria cubensis]